MKETVEYQVEWKNPGERRYSKNYSYFKDKEVAMCIAAAFGHIDVCSVRVVEQRRKIIKVFVPKNPAPVMYVHPNINVARETAQGRITPAASGDKGKIDITAMTFNTKEDSG